MLRADRAMQQKLFTGLLNEGILMQSKAAGALCSLTTEADIDALVDATRRVMLRIR